MITLNIIPNEIKKELKLKGLFALMKNILNILTILIAFYSIIFLCGKLILNIYFTNIIQESNLLIKKTEDKTGKIREINTQINSVEKIQAESKSWTNMLLAITELMGEQIKLNQLKLDSVNNTISFTGRSASREDLIQLKNQLEQSPNFSEVNFPIKNLFEKENINFEINAKIKSYEFEQP